MTTMKISDRMAEAISNVTTTDDKGAQRLRFSVLSGTVVALINRGLVRYDSDRTREDGYETHVLTPRGEALRMWLEENPGRSSFRVETLDAGARTITEQRGARMVTVPLMVKQANGGTEGFVVASLTVPENETNAARAELSKWAGRNPIPFAIRRESRWDYYIPHPEPVQDGAPCGRRIDPRQIINVAPSELACVRIEGHRGQHRDTESLTRHSFVWDDDACLTPRQTSPAIVWEDRSNRANVREVSKVLRAAGLPPRNGEKIMARSGYQATQDGERVCVSWREGADTDLMGNSEWDETRAAMNDAYADALAAAGYPLRRRVPGSWVYVTGPKRKR